MKGLQHSVIEIKDTESEEIERILVFLKPGEHKISLNNTRREAENILQKVKVKKKAPKIKANRRLALAASVLGALRLVAILLFI